MFHHILIPTDLSDQTKGTVDTARDLALGAGARVTLFHVIETLSGAEFKEFESFYQELEDRAAKHLVTWPHDSAARTSSSPPPRSMANRPRRLSPFAEDNQVDLIMLASHTVDPSQPGRGWAA